MQGWPAGLCTLQYAVHMQQQYEVVAPPTRLQGTLGTLQFVNRGALPELFFSRPRLNLHSAMRDKSEVWDQLAAEDAY